MEPIHTDSSLSINGSISSSRECCKSHDSSFFSPGLVNKVSAYIHWIADISIDQERAIATTAKARIPSWLLTSVLSERLLYRPLAPRIFKVLILIRKIKSTFRKANIVYSGMPIVISSFQSIFCGSEMLQQYVEIQNRYSDCASSREPNRRLTILHVG